MPRTNSPLCRMVAALAVMVLLAGACGDDDATTSTDTTAAGGQEGGKKGELVGMKGTTPLTELDEAFKKRLLEVSPGLKDFNYGAESYDAVMTIALATELAKTDGIAMANEINGVTRKGEKCTSFKACKDLVAAGKDIDYDGVAGPADFSGNGEPTIGSYGVLEFGDDNRIDDSKTTYKIANAPPEADVPQQPAQGTRMGDGVLKIGTLLPETGSLAFLGPPEFAGIDLAVKEINELGGVLGKPVQTTKGDSGDTSTDIATQTVNRELSEGVDAIIGAASSSVTLTVIDKIVNAGVVMFSPANTSKKLSTYNDKGLYFRNAPSDILQGGVLAEVVSEDNHENVGILALDDDYGTGLAEDFKKAFEESGGKVVDTIIYDPAATSFDAEITKMKGNDVDAILLIGFDESSKVLATMIEKGIGPNDVPVYGTDGNMGNALGENVDAGK
jgi:ABC-type branched-subunit amino acid transport system substrate-binding protein